jgi:hypothetical protein
MNLRIVLNSGLFAKTHVLFLVLSIPIAIGQTEDKETLVWPKLETVPFVSGRAATEADVNAGRAAFLLKLGDSSGRPLKISLPQYAVHVDASKNARTPCILIQAEEINGQKAGGCRIVGKDSFLVGLMNEFELYGSVAPRR